VTWLRQEAGLLQDIERCLAAADVVRTGKAYLDDPADGFPGPNAVPGFKILTRWQKDGSLAVEAVIEGSPAAESGVAVGDRLLEIDGRPLAAIGQDGVRARLRVDGAEVRLKLERGGETIEKRLRLRRLV